VRVVFQLDLLTTASVFDLAARTLAAFSVEGHTVAKHLWIVHMDRSAIHHRDLRLGLKIASFKRVNRFSGNPNLNGAGGV